MNEEINKRVAMLRESAARWHMGPVDVPGMETPVGAVWSDAVFAPSFLSEIKTDPIRYIRFLTALFNRQEDWHDILPLFDRLAGLLDKSSNEQYSAGDEACASDLYQASLLCLYANFSHDRSFRYLNRVNFEITSLCNLRCKYCNFQSGKRQPYLNPETYGIILEELAQKVPHLARLGLYTSGESLLHPKFEEILGITRRIKEAYPEFRPLTYLHTNGMLWTPERNDRILATGALDQVTWSIDGADKESFEEMRRGACFETVMNHFNYFLEHRPANVKAVVNRLLDAGSAARPLCAEMASAYRAADAVNTIEPKQANTRAPAESQTRWAGRCDGFCEYPFHTVVVTTDARMILCCFDYNALNAFGDVERDGFEATYYGEARRNLLQRMADQKRGTISGCRTCKLVRNAWSTGSRMRRDINRNALRNEERIRAFWTALREQSGIQRVALFGAGKYTVWLEGVLAGIRGPEVAAVLDDAPEGRPILFGCIPVAAKDFDAAGVNAILLATDTFQQSMQKRCRQLYGDDTRLLEFSREIDFE